MKLIPSRLINDCTECPHAVMVDGNLHCHHNKIPRNGSVVATNEELLKWNEAKSFAKKNDYLIVIASPVSPPSFCPLEDE